MRSKARLAAGVTIAAMTAIGTLALAQTRGKPLAKPAKPPAAARADGAAPMTPDEGPGAAVDASASAADPPTAPELGDGVTKPSPLNPQPQEMPGASAVDAGTPLDYDRLLADIAALRARVAAVSDNLYQSRVAIALQTDGDRARLGRLTVSLDDGVVYTAPSSFSASDMTVVYEHAVAPGRHAITIEVDRKDARDEAFRTSQRNRFAVDVPRDNRLDVQVKLTDESSMGGDFPADRSGAYDLRIKVKAVAKPAGK